MSLAERACVITIGIPSIHDLETVAADIRVSDRRDMQGLHPGKPVYEILMGDVALSRMVYGLYLRGKIAAVFGVVPSGPGIGTPWLAASTCVERNKLSFARMSVRMLDMIQKPFPVLDTWVCAENSMSLHWHSWCGFEFASETVRIGRDRFYRAVRIVNKQKEKI
ncbi:hypothetical protein [Maridesulfovibrio sp.]|uniref:hypothetical protein n=1 Tax=Maridesulfovibrio sp. TaxID=2795000 RepID=UPI002A18DAE5|nr:hypothetical protein [Maridesulfovibrio sp.]